MRQTVIVSALTAVVTVVLSVLVLNQLGAGAVSSASAPDISVSNGLPSSEDGQIQGDTDCDGDVDAVDGLGVLVNVAALDALAQQEPCTDVADVIPAGEGIPGPQGPTGPQGEQGPAGPPGISGVEVVIEQGDDPSPAKSASAICDDGKVVLGGGAQVTGNTIDVALYQSRPLDNPAGWFAVAARVDLLPASNWQVTAYAVCANVAE